jgi:hypothetical protein
MLPSFSHHVTIILPSFSQHVPIIFPSCSHQFAMIFPSFCHQFPIIFPSICHQFASHVSLFHFILDCPAMLGPCPQDIVEVEQDEVGATMTG